MNEIDIRLAAIVESSDDAIITKTVEGIITSWNPGAERIFGYTASEIVGRSVTVLFPEDRLAEEEEFRRRLVRGERVKHFETVRVRKDGSLINISVALSPMRAPGGRLLGISKIARDITERAKLLARDQAARREAEQANRVKDEFLATLSHELRTPLNAILGWARMLRTGRLDAATAARALEAIERNARLQSQLIEDLLDLSRIISGKIRLTVCPVDLAAVIEAALDQTRPAALAKAIQLELDLDRAAGAMLGDTERLQQVVSNILSNAVKFTPTGGHVEVRLERDDSEVRIQVRDSGSGIPADLLPHVFDRFRQGDSTTRRAQGGLGLGLAIVREIVELHGGTVEAQSPGPGKGATFTVRLPFRAAGLALRAIGSEPTATDARDDALAGATVLLVEDDADSRVLLATMLEQRGARVLPAASVREALDVLGRQRPDVLVSDIGMPEEDGYDLIAAVRALPPDRGGLIPAVAVTALARGEDAARALRAGYQIHLAKPVEPDRLVEAVVGVLSRRAG